MAARHFAVPALGGLEEGRQGDEREVGEEEPYLPTILMLLPCVDCFGHGVSVVDPFDVALVEAGKYVT